MRDEPFDGLSRKTFSCILADPPWRFQARTALQAANWSSRRDVDKHYETMSWQEIAALPVGDLGTPHSHLWLWTTGPCLEQAFQVMSAWGYRYSAIGLVWLKTKRSTGGRQLKMYEHLEEELHVGLGLTTRHNVELCLLGRRGNARRNAKDVREVVVAPVREHSRKPDEAFRRIERYCDGPYLDLFSRQQRPNWVTWGNETTKFTEAAE